MESIKGSVLIVDDDPYLVETLIQALTADGYFAVGAKDGAEAIALTNLVRYDLILLDLHLPTVEGTEVAKLFKERAATVPIVIMTGHPMGQEFTQFVKGLGVSGRLEKPFGLEELFAVVRTHYNMVPCSPNNSFWQTY